MSDENEKSAENNVKVDMNQYLWKDPETCEKSDARGALNAADEHASISDMFLDGARSVRMAEDVLGLTLKKKYQADTSVASISQAADKTTIIIKLTARGQSRLTAVLDNLIGANTPAPMPPRFAIGVAGYEIVEKAGKAWNSEAGKAVDCIDKEIDRSERYQMLFDLDPNGGVEATFNAVNTGIEYARKMLQDLGPDEVKGMIDKTGTQGWSHCAAVIDLEGNIVDRGLWRGL